MTPLQTTFIIEIREASVERGYWQGMRQPAVVATLRLPPIDDELRRMLRHFDRLSGQLLPAPAKAPAPPQLAHPVLQRVATSVLMILAAAKLPIMGGAEAVRVPKGEGEEWLLGLPTVRPDGKTTEFALRWAVRLFQAIQEDRPLDLDARRTALERGIEVLKGQAPQGVNSLPFLEAAHRAGIPWRYLAKNVYQLGWGRRARWIDSSYTDETPVISSRLARDKVACLTLLRDAGLPVPRHYSVGSPEQALAAAGAVGYPVVLKPANLDGGVGVFVRLETPDALRTAYTEVAKLTRRILVEQYIEGSDYRLQVHRGEVFWVVQRRPAYVTGDGKHSVQALIEQTNAARTTPVPPDQPGERAPLPIKVGSETESWLASQGLALHSVPAAGRHVRLRGAANVSNGGTLEPVLEVAHPDNLALASTVTRLLRLDLAGIDLLMPDIRRSWREGGAAICEVNAQPQLSAGLHAGILARLVQGDGRIPVVGMIGQYGLGGGHRGLLKAAAERGRRLAVAAEEGAWVGGERAVMATGDLMRTTRGLLADPQLDALILAYSQPDRLSHSWPVDELSLLCVVGDIAGVPESVLHSACRRAGAVMVLEGLSDSVERLCALQIAHTASDPATLRKRLYTTLELNA